MRLALAVAAGFAVALVAPMLSRRLGDAFGWLMAVVPVGLCLYFATLLPQVAGGQPIVVTYAWVPTLGVQLSFHADGLALLFALLISGVGTLVIIYASGYLAGHPDLGRFYQFLALFMASMLGLVLAGNALTLFVFWELTSVSSYLLIGFDHEREEARVSALQALLVTGGGGLALLGGLVLLGQIGGSYEIATLLTRGEAVRAHPLYAPMLLLVLVGAFTKSAQMPFHFWLPGAMVAPTPVSAYLHSATMVKAGIYLLARLLPALGGTQMWTVVVTAVGAVTMVGGGILAFYQTDLKRLLACSTISALGILTMLLGIGTRHAVEAMAVFLLAHALYKGALFMVAGAVEHETGTRDVEQLGGLWRAMPVTAAVAALAAVSLAGFGPVLSFIGKELLMASVLEVPEANTLLVPAAVLAGTLFVTAAAIVGIKPFWGRLVPMPQSPHEAPFSLWIGPALLAMLGVACGLAPAHLAELLITPAVGAVSSALLPVTLALWHGFNAPLLLSTISVVIGLALFVLWAPLRRATRRLDVASHYGPTRWYQVSLDGLNAVARGQTRLLQNGYLRFYVMTIIVTTTALVAYAYASRDRFPGLPASTGIGVIELVLATLIVLGAFVTACAPSRLSSVAALGVVGYGVALTYLLYGAPDLAMTQFMTETLTVILFVLVFYYLPRFTRLSRARVLWRDAAIASAFGMLMMVLVLAAAGLSLDSELRDFYARNSRTLAHGRNVVDVILVDFRALDTLGEITVLGVAAVGVFALLKLRPPKEHR